MSVTYIVIIKGTWKHSYTFVVNIISYDLYTCWVYILFMFKCVYFDDIFSFKANKAKREDTYQNGGQSEQVALTTQLKTYFYTLSIFRYSEMDNS